MICRLVGLSSATRIRAGGTATASGSGTIAASAARRLAAATAAPGSENRKVLPSPGTLSTVDLAAHQLDQLPRDGEAEAGAAALRG